MSENVTVNETPETETPEVVVTVPSINKKTIKAIAITATLAAAVTTIVLKWKDRPSDDAEVLVLEVESDTNVSEN